MKNKPATILQLVKSSEKQESDIRKHFIEAGNTMFGNGNSPVNGYALVTFHENGAYSATYHVVDSGIHQIDLPDMVKIRLLETAITEAMKVK
jgi:hypothetical protein